MCFLKMTALCPRIPPSSKTKLSVFLYFRIRPCPIHPQNTIFFIWLNPFFFSVLKKTQLWLSHSNSSVKFLEFCILVQNTDKVALLVSYATLKSVFFYLFYQKRLIWNKILPDNLKKENENNCYFMCKSKLPIS